MHLKFSLKFKILLRRFKNTASGLVNINLGQYIHFYAKITGTANSIYEAMTDGNMPFCRSDLEWFEDSVEIAAFTHCEQI